MIFDRKEPPALLPMPFQQIFIKLFANYSFFPHNLPVLSESFAALHIWKTLIIMLRVSWSFSAAK